MSTDIAGLMAPVDSAKMPVINPDTLEPIIAADGQPWEIEFAGPNHPISKQVQHGATRRAFRTLRKRAGDEDPAQMERDAIDNLVKRTLGWNAPVLNGQEFPFSAENARLLYTQSPAVRNQANGFLNDDASFLPKPAKS
jgi:hypothetical protein